MGIPTAKKLYKLTGLSTETKPILEDMCTGSTYLETDTGVTYIYNASIKAWLSSSKSQNHAITKGIFEIKKTSDNQAEIDAGSTEPLKDIYTIKYTNGAETTFAVTHGTYVTINNLTAEEKLVAKKAYDIKLSNGTDRYFDLVKATKFEAALVDDSLEILIDNPDFIENRKDEGLFIVKLQNHADLVFRYIGTKNNEQWIAEALEPATDPEYRGDFEVVTYVGSFDINDNSVVFTAEKQIILPESIEEALKAINIRIDGVENDINDLEDSIDDLAEDINQVKEDLVAEYNRAVAKENTLEASINSEAARAEQAESLLDEKISAEETRAEGAEQALGAEIKAEQVRAEAAEQGLNEAIVAEQARATEEEQNLGLRIDDEASARRSKDEDLEQAINAEQTRAENAEGELNTKVDNYEDRITAIEDDYLKAEDKAELQGNIDAVSARLSDEEARAEREEGLIKDRLDDIEDLIPEQASSENQLADKDFVNSSIATATATFRGSYNLVTDLGLTIDATEGQIAEALTQEMVEHLISPDNNDYVFVQIPVTEEAPKEIEKIDRYKFDTVNWIYEYTLNNSSFTEAQWKAINSGITTETVAQIETNKQDILSISGDISDINSAIDDISTNLENAQEAIRDLNNDVGTLQSDVSTINQAIDNIKDGDELDSFKDVEEALSELDLEKASKEELAQLEEALTAILNELDEELADEITRARAVENQITSNLEDEVINRQADVDAEQQRAEDKEQQLQDSIDNIDQELTTISGDVSDLQDTIDNLDLQDVGQDGSYIKIVGQENGQLSATAQSFDTTFDTPTDRNAPTTKLVSDSLDEFSSKALDQELVDNIYLSTCLEDGVDLVLYESSEQEVPDLLEFGEFNLNAMEDDPLPGDHPEAIEGNEATLEESDEIRFNSNNVALAGDTIYLGDSLTIVPPNEDTEDDNGGND